MPSSTRSTGKSTSFSARNCASSSESRLTVTRRRPASASAAPSAAAASRSSSGSDRRRARASSATSRSRSRRTSGSPPVMRIFSHAPRDEERARRARSPRTSAARARSRNAMVAAEDLLRHAVDAAEVAAVGDRDAQIAQRAAEGVEHVHRGNRSSRHRPRVCSAAEGARPRLIARVRPLIVLVAVTAVWGVTFVQVKDAVALYPLFAFLAVRFAIASCALAAGRLARLRTLGRAGWRPERSPARCSARATRCRLRASNGRPSRRPASSPGCTSC